MNNIPTFVPFNYTAAHMLVMDQSMSSALLLGGTTILCVFLWSQYRRQDVKDFHHLGGISIITAWGFFTKRFDFLRSNFRKTGQNIFQFRVLQHRILATSGAEARKLFFNDPSLNLTEGYRILSGAPSVQAINVKRTSTLEDFMKRIRLLLRQDRIQSVLPSLLNDTDANMRSWGKEGKIDPFNELYTVVFQMTVRMATCRELANNSLAVKSLQTYFWNHEKSITPMSLLFPWFPSPSRKTMESSIRGLFTTLHDYVERRKAAGGLSDDTIDVLLREGDETQRVVEVIMGIIFAGVVNTGMSVCWLVLFLGVNPSWSEKVKSEINTFIARHTDPLSKEPLAQRLHSVPVSAWDDDFPILELCIRETLRLTMSLTAFRRNVHKELTLDGKIIKLNDFIAYPLSDTHLDPSIYSDPEMFDPDRYGPGREEDKKLPYAYVAWGAGRHPCAGMRVAKLEMKLALVLMLGNFEYEVVDKDGRSPKALPMPNRNDLQTAHPMGEPCFVKFKRRN